MPEITVNFRQPVKPDEPSLIFAILKILLSNDELRNQQKALEFHEIRLNRHHKDEYGQDCVTTCNMSYERFIDIVNKGMGATLNLTVQTEDGPQTISRECLPVTLFNVPFIKHASVMLNYVPEFCPNNISQEPNFTFYGELGELLQKDISGGAQ